MSKVLDFLLHGRLVGTLANVAGDLNVVALDDAFRSDANAPTLSWKALRDRVTGQYVATVRPTTKRVHPYFANLLPEGQLRAYIATAAGVNVERDFPLLWYLGEDLPGAIVVRDPDRGSPAPETAPPERDFRRRPLRFSLAGVQLKFSVTGTPGRGLTIPVDGSGGGGIVKLPDQRFARVPETEFAMMTFARAVGIDVPPIALVDLSDVDGIPSGMANQRGPAFWIARFDRLPGGARVHTEDFAQVNALYPERKYGGFNYDMLVDQAALATGLDGALDVIRRIVFNVGIGNGDMHAKNWSLIYRDARTPSLAPAYDYLSTILFLEDDNLGMNLAGTKAFGEVDLGRLDALAERGRLPRKPVFDAAAEMVERMRSAWPAIAAQHLLAAERMRIEAHMATIPLFRSPVSVSRGDNTSAASVSTPAERTGSTAKPLPRARRGRFRR